MQNYALDLNENDKRIIIVGGPRTGKSTLARSLRIDRGMPTFCGDPLSKVKEPQKHVTYLPEGLDWSAGSQYVADEWFDMPGPWVMEGQIMARALRKHLRAGKSDVPADKIVVLKRHHPKAEVTPGQAAMHKSVMTVWREIQGHFEQSAEYPEFT